MLQKFNLLGIGSGKASLDDSIAMASTRLRMQQWKNCQHLIIDEISMVDAEFFDKIEAVARAVRKCQAPFGGIQLIVCGDFLQLPPVAKSGDSRKFCFQVGALCFVNCKVGTRKLKIIIN